MELVRRIIKSKASIAIGGFVLGFLASNLVPVLQFQWEIRTHSEELSPEIDTHYTFHPDDNTHHFFLHNVGLVGCTDIWAEEAVFVAIGGAIYEGTDLPHFNYFVYDGSRNRMWNLTKGNTLEVELAEHQMLAFSQVIRDFDATLISRWKIIFSATGRTKGHFQEDYYVYDDTNNVFRRAEAIVGGQALVEEVKAYLASGPRRTVRIFDLTGSFEIDPPPAYLIKRDYSILPVYPSTRLTLGDIHNSLTFIPEKLEIQEGADSKVSGTLCYSWTNENGIWRKTWTSSGKGETYTQWTRTLFYYLSADDNDKVAADPGLLHFASHDLQGSRPDDATIRARARDLYLSDRRTNQLSD